jgi:hypothetical protein
MIVFKTQMNVFGTTVTYKDPESVLEDVRIFLTEHACCGNRFLIMVENMSEE